MSLINIEHLNFSYYGYSGAIFDDVSFQIDTNWKTGLIGRNGIGKSTFFKILLGKEEYTGRITKSVDFTLFPPDIRDDSIFGIEIFYELNPFSEEWKLFKELNLLEVDEGLLYRPFNQLSKGEQTKILLAMLFTREGDFLLIDEPTNHLDIEGRKIVGDYLKKKDGFLLISHDRNFLDSCIDHVLSINRTTIDIISGNFSTWYENKERLLKNEMAQNERLSKDISRLSEASKKNKTWSNKVEATKNGTKISGSKPDKGYIGHKSAKMMKRSKNLEKRQEKAIEEKKSLLKDVEKSESLKLHQLSHHKENLISVKNLSIFYGKHPVCEGVSFDVKRGDRLVVSGKNGSGKSSVLRLILDANKGREENENMLNSKEAGLKFEEDELNSRNSEELGFKNNESLKFSGEISLASDIIISHIPQDASSLSGSLDKIIKSWVVDETLCKTILRKLDFKRESFEIDVENYSEGQKKKVLLALSLSKHAHIFIWDEPLNYIDVISRIQIEDIILNENPTLIFVEHDSLFVEKIANKRVDIKRLTE